MAEQSEAALSSGEFLQRNGVDEDATKAQDLNEEGSSCHPELSKRQLKKLLKRQKYKELRPQKRKEEKRRRAERKRQLREMVAQGLIDPPFQEGSKRTKEMSHEDAYPLRIAIDLSFDHLMNEKDILKLIKQLQRCYSANRRANHPLQLFLTNFGGQCKEILDSKKQNYKNWDVHLRSESYLDVFKKEELVYLTAESPNVLSDLDMSKLYVIGGLVDHNRHKGLCHRLAVEQGLNHAQLPIDQFIKLNTRKVLAVNHVFEIILYFMESRSWQDAFFKVIPPRKGVTLKCENNEEGRADAGICATTEDIPRDSRDCAEGGESGDDDNYNTESKDTVMEIHSHRSKLLEDTHEDFEMEDGIEVDTQELKCDTGGC